MVCSIIRWPFIYFQNQILNLLEVNSDMNCPAFLSFPQALNQN